MLQGVKPTSDTGAVRYKKGIDVIDAKGIGLFQSRLERHLATLYHFRPPSLSPLDGAEWVFSRLIKRKA